MRKIFILLTASLLILGACGSDEVIGSPTDVRNDVTGKWKKATTSENIDITEHALDYANKHMENGDTHFIINFTNNTTSILNLSGDMLFVSVHERVDKEEHDAKTIGSGTLLKEYVIYSDGTVEEIK